MSGSVFAKALLFNLNLSYSWEASERYAALKRVFMIPDIRPLLEAWKAINT